MWIDSVVDCLVASPGCAEAEQVNDGAISEDA